MAAEKNFENKVKGFLRDRGCWFLKTWSNGVQRSGVPDLLVCCKGTFLGVELKAENGKPSALQLHNLKRINDSGGYGILLYPSDFGMFIFLIESIVEGLPSTREYYYYYFKCVWENFIDERNDNSED